MLRQMIRLLAAIGLVAGATSAPAGSFAQGPKLVGAGAAGVGLFGVSVALSSDGNTAIAGGSGDSSGTGAAWVFTRSGGVWTQQGAKLVGAGSIGSATEGYKVALSGDGSTAILGGYDDNSITGAAWIFTRSGSTWSQQGPKLVGGDAVGAAAQGGGVVLSSDGNTALIGGPYDNSNAGATWVFTRSGGVWTQQGAKLVGPGAAGSAQQGTGVAISSDANTVITGGAQDNSQTGAAWVFTRLCAHGDVNGDGVLNVNDIFYLINFLFAGGAAPACY